AAPNHGRLWRAIAAPDTAPSAPIHSVRTTSTGTAPASPRTFAPATTLSRESFRSACSMGENRGTPTRPSGLPKVPPLSRFSPRPGFVTLRQTFVRSCQNCVEGPWVPAALTLGGATLGDQRLLNGEPHRQCYFSRITRDGLKRAMLPFCYPIR